MENNYLNDIYKAVTGVELIPNALVPLQITPSGSTQHFEPSAPAYGFSQVDVQAVSLNDATVVPSLEQQTVVPDRGNLGLAQVVVAPTPLEEKTVSPSDEVQVLTPSAGKLGFSKVTVNPSASSSSWKYYALCAAAPMYVFNNDSKEELTPSTCTVHTDAGTMKTLHYKLSLMSGVKTLEVLDTAITDFSQFHWKRADSFFNRLYVYTDGDEYEGHVALWELDGFNQSRLYQFTYGAPTMSSPTWYAVPSSAGSFDASFSSIFTWWNTVEAYEITDDEYLSLNWSDADKPLAVVKA